MVGVAAAFMSDHSPTRNDEIFHAGEWHEPLLAELGEFFKPRKHRRGVEPCTLPQEYLILIEVLSGYFTFEMRPHSEESAKGVMYCRFVVRR